MEDTSFYQNFPTKSSNEPDEVQHTIRGVTADPAVPAAAGETRVAQAQAVATQVAFRADRTPPFAPTPALQPEPPEEQESLIFLESNLDMAPTQVRNNSSQPDVSAHETENAADEDEAPTTSTDFSRRTDNRWQVRTPRKLLTQAFVNRFIT